ncbi:hypothetical protein J7E24_01770 [Hymenobacter sp. ISL-91]|uniref:hypothetical protein n=1 Tax=Hymenobacter sp. ISL-91 TaxID=2819151 RepID=UPI001BE8B137|nr:hypothetical protein [Hymenobacter sp. ISL-91]MBT2556506.1 hypothetical protein [Hymenobacter sp. ISL-91]
MFTKPLYYRDGSLRDIFIFNTSRDDWAKWAELVNSEYSVEYKYYDTDKTETAIDIANVFAVWDGLSEQYARASINVGGCIVNCFFFVENELDNDIAPKEIHSIEEHNALMHYLLQVSALLQKPVVLTPELTPEEILLIAINGQIQYPKVSP